MFGNVHLSISEMSSDKVQPERLTEESPGLYNSNQSEYSPKSFFNVEEFDAINSEMITWAQTLDIDNACHNIETKTNGIILNLFLIISFISSQETFNSKQYCLK